MTGNPKSLFFDWLTAPAEKSGQQVSSSRFGSKNRNVYLFFFFFLLLFGSIWILKTFSSCVNTKAMTTMTNIITGLWKNVFSSSFFYLLPQGVGTSEWKKVFFFLLFIYSRTCVRAYTVDDLKYQLESNTNTHTTPTFFSYLFFFFVCVSWTYSKAGPYFVILLCSFFFYFFYIWNPKELTSVQQHFFFRSRNLFLYFWLGGNFTFLMNGAKVSSYKFQRKNWGRHKWNRFLMKDNFRITRSRCGFAPELQMPLRVCLKERKIRVEPNISWAIVGRQFPKGTQKIPFKSKFYKMDCVGLSTWLAFHLSVECVCARSIKNERNKKMCNSILLFFFHGNLPSSPLLEGGGCNRNFHSLFFSSLCSTFRFCTAFICFFELSESFVWLFSLLLLFHFFLSSPLIRPHDFSQGELGVTRVRADTHTHKTNWEKRKSRPRPSLTFGRRRRPLGRRCVKRKRRRHIFLFLFFFLWK